MAVSRFDTAVQGQYQSQYVPIPFQELYQIGRDARADIDAAYNNLSNQFQTWSQFRSPSDVDTAAWYDATIGSVMPTVNELAANPDLIKTPIGRLKLQQAINSVDYAKLSGLQQSRDNLLQRQQINQQLALNGRYNEDWHGIDYANYDTSSNGVFNDLAPTPYQTIRELTNQYYAQLKPGDLGTKGGYDYTGISREQIIALANDNIQNITATPEAQKYLETRMRQTGETAEQAQEWLRNRVIEENLDRAVITRQANPFALSAQKPAATAAGKKQTGTPARFTDQLHLQGERYITELGTQLPGFLERVNAQMLQQYDAQIQSQLQSGDRAGAEATARSRNSEIRSAADAAIKDALSETFIANLPGDIDNPNLSPGDLQNAASLALDVISSDNTSEGTNAIVSTVASRTARQDGTTYYVANNTKSFKLPYRLLESLDPGVVAENVPTAFDKLTRDGLKNVYVDGITNKGVVNYTSPNGEFRQAQRVVVTVDEANINASVIKNQFKDPDKSAKENRGKYNTIEDFMLANGASITTEDPTVTITQRSNFEPDTGGLFRSANPNRKRNEKRGESTSTRGTQKRFYSFEMLVDIPNERTNELGTQETNTKYNQFARSASDASTDFLSEQNDAFRYYTLD